MCGITGASGPGGSAIVRKMTPALVHRGPDGEGYFDSDAMALGHRRLSIVDLEGGAQPISNEDDTLILVCNGEIYNSPELRQELLEKGHRFKTETDVEVILHLYEEHGLSCVERLRGMFAFAIWDTTQSRLLLARDHLGQKPLYFCQAGERLLFASEPKAILASGCIDPELDIDGMWHYMSLRYLPDEHSLFRSIRKLPAASIAVFESGSISVKKYWEPMFISKRDGSEAQIVEELDALVQETVKLHLLSDVPVGSFLSGGIDSGTVASIAAQNQPTPLSTFSIGVDDKGFNELPYARQVAERYGMNMHERVVDADLIRLIPKMIYHMDEPSDPFGVGMYLASQLASEHVKVTLSGDGGDENFAGYDRFAGQRLVDYYCVLPAWFRRSFMKKAINLIPDSFGYNSIAQKAKWVNEMSFYERGERYAQSMSFLRFRHEQKERLLTPAAMGRIQSPDSVAKILRYFDADNAEDLVDRMLYTDLMTRLPDHLLTLGDRMSMAHSLESRPVLVDYKIVEFAASIPANLKLKGSSLKYILKKVAERHMPLSVIQRPKQGFSFPIANWMRTDLSQFMRRLFDNSRFVEAGLFQKEFISELVDEHLDGTADHNYRLWVLINLEFWHRIYLEGASLDTLREEADELMAA